MVKDVSFRIIGLVILSSAKLNLYQLIYNGLKPVFGNNMKGIFTHTDSFLAKIIDPDRNYLTKLKGLGHIFDFSTLDPSHILYDTSSKGKTGIFKIVHDGILEFLAISCSMYSIVVDNGSKHECINKHGGISKSIADRELRHETYRNAIKNGRSKELKINSLTVSNGQILEVQASRIGIGGIDLKRFHLPDGTSLPFGHFKIKNII